MANIVEVDFKASRIAAYGEPYTRAAPEPKLSPLATVLVWIGAAIFGWACVFATIGLFAGLTLFVLRVVAG